MLRIKKQLVIIFIENFKKLPFYYKLYAYRKFPIYLIHFISISKNLLFIIMYKNFKIISMSVFINQIGDIEFPNLITIKKKYILI